LKVAGTSLFANAGTLSPITGEGLVASTDTLIHDSPKPANTGEVTFRFTWQAPDKPGAVTFVVAAVAANGDGRSSGDAPGYREFQFAFGCQGREYYRDSDRDGYGTNDLPTVLACDGDPPDQLALVGGDCDDYNDALHPGATELCNGKDDDCDGQIDQGLDSLMLWPDTDGDGYYASQTGTPKVGCTGLKGYAALPGDCAPSDPSVHPGATETCNGRDDNCDGRADERVRPQCGLGWCRRESPTCNPNDCQPGQPMPETCNQFDDDCNGIDDDGLVCSNGSGGSSAGGVNGAGGIVSAAGGSMNGVGGNVSGASGGVNAAGGNVSGASGGASKPATEDDGAGCGVARGSRGSRGASGWIAVLASAALLRRGRRRW
jgi:hypothetical protein